MSRSNPYKRPRRTVQQTALLVVEGETEEAFCKYLKIEYNRDCGLAVRIHNARGRGPDFIIEQARKQCSSKGFDRVFILMDADLEIALARSHRTVKSLRAIIWLSEPQCIEGFFLMLLGRSPPTTSQDCKDEFHTFGISESDKLDWESYQTLFPRERLEELRSNHPHLDNLIKLFSNKLWP
jgi:hypothetical protein